MPTGTNVKKLFNESTGTTNTVSSIDLIKQEVEFLLGFQKYSLFFGNNMGFSPQKYLGLRNRIATYNLIKSDLVDLFAKYKRAKIQSLDITFDEQNSRLIIDLTLTTNNYTQGSFNVSFDINN